jgi:hypothetical protein
LSRRVLARQVFRYDPNGVRIEPDASGRHRRAASGFLPTIRDGASDQGLSRGA